MASRPSAPSSSSARYPRHVVQQEMIQVSGIRCERCVNRLALALEGHPGLEGAQANLVGQVMLAWDDEQTSREALLAALGKAGFRESAAAAAR